VAAIVIITGGQCEVKVSPGFPGNVGFPIVTKSILLGKTVINCVCGRRSPARLTYPESACGASFPKYTLWSFNPEYSTCGCYRFKSS